MIGAGMTTLANGLRRMALPLSAYYGVTLALPVANGAAWSDAVFVKHAGAVLVVPIATIALVCVVMCGLRSLTSRRSRSRLWSRAG